MLQESDKMFAHTSAEREIWGTKKAIWQVNAPGI